MTDKPTREQRDRAANYIDREITKYRKLGNMDMAAGLGLSSPSGRLEPHEIVLFPKPE